MKDNTVGKLATSIPVVTDNEKEIPTPPYTTFWLNWSDTEKVYWETRHVVALLPKKIHKKIINLPISKWIPATKILSDSDSYYIDGPIGPSGNKYQEIVDAYYYDAFKKDLSTNDVYLHPDSDCEYMAVLIDIENFIVMIAAVKGYEKK